MVGYHGHNDHEALVLDDERIGLGKNIIIPPHRFILLLLLFKLNDWGNS
jgi:hypothetical protein